MQIESITGTSKKGRIGVHLKRFYVKEADPMLTPMDIHNKEFGKKYSWL